jgi:hypothetical protein
MWCRACQQDVPGVVTSSQNPTVRCARCGQPLAGSGSDRTGLLTPHFTLSAQGTGDGTIARPDDCVVSGSEDFPEFVELEDGDFEAWDFEETIRRAQQLVKRVTSESAIDSVQPASDGAGAAREPSERRAAATVPPPARPSGTLPWLILAFGFGVFACGAALIGLSFVKDSTPLWQLGLPMVLGGQLAVLFVVIWQLDVVWHSHRATFVALHAMDEQLRQLRLHAPHAQAGQPEAKAFLQHLSEGASPYILLNDLRAQLDALSTRLDKTKDAA